MKPKDLLHAMEHVDPALLEQSIRGEETAADIEMTAEHEVTETRESPILRTVGTAASLVACAAIVAGGVLWLRHASAQRPQVADASSAQHSQTDTEPAESTHTEIAPETDLTAVHATVTSTTDLTVTDADGSTVTTSTSMPIMTRSALITTTSAPVSGSTPATIINTGTHTTLATTNTTASTTSTTAQPAETDPPAQSTTAARLWYGFPCEVTPKIWNSSWYNDDNWTHGSPTPAAMIIRSNRQMMERNAVDERTYVYEQCGWATDAFFKDYDLIVCAVESGTGSIEVGVKALNYVTARDPFDKDKSWVNLDLAKYFPEVQTCDMCTVCIAIPVPKGLIPENVQTVYTTVDTYQTEWDEMTGAPIRDPDPHTLFTAACPNPLYIEHAEAIID